jgi:hypothetical protein
VKEFIEKYGVLIIAVYGVVQVWLIALWKNIIRTGRISIFQSGKVEVGFSNFGPTIAINGTLLAKHKDVFISDISVNIQKVRDGSSHKFKWTAFRSPQFKLGKADSITLEIPSGFIVKTDSPHRFQIFFSDNKTQDEITPSLIDVEKDWRDFLKKKDDEIKKAITEIGVTYGAVAEGLYNNEFIKLSVSHQKAWDVLSRKNYWEEGQYSCKIIVTASMPNKVFESPFEFHLDNSEFEKLRLNAVATLRELTTGATIYSFAYVDFK